MYNVCTKCDSKQYEIIDGNVICSACGNKIALSKQPLFIVLGASGSGKSSLCTEFASNFKQVVSLDGDCICDYSVYKNLSNGVQMYRNELLRVCKNVIQFDKPVILYNSGMPEDYKICEEFKFFNKVYFLALVCDDDELEKHLQQRRKYRDCGNDVFIARQKIYNDALKSNVEGNIIVIDNTNLKSRQTTILFKSIIFKILGW